MARARTIGILGRRRDAEVKALEAALSRAGADPVVVDFHGFPRFNLATLEPRLTFDDALRLGTVELDAIDLWVLRTLCYDHPEPDVTLPATQVRQLSQQQIAKLAFQHCLVGRLEHAAPVINPARSFRFHREKPFQHQLLLRRGITTPRTLVTRDPEQARAFVAGFERGAVAKPLTSAAEVVKADEAFFAAHADRIRHRPFMFQQYVKGRALRAYLLGGRVVSAGEIHYDQRFVDWRERTQRVSTGELDDALVATLERAVRLLELPYCGIDVEWDQHSERHYVLDLNPSALFVGWSRLAGLDMAERIASYVLRVAEQGGDPWLGRPAPAGLHS